MKLSISLKFFLGLYFIGFCCYGQMSSDPNDVRRFTSKRISTDLYLQGSVPIGDNYFADGLSSGLGFGGRIQYFVFQDIFLGVGLSYEFYDVTDRATVGNYSSTRKSNLYTYGGYEFKIKPQLDLGIFLGLGFNTSRNKLISGQGSDNQYDSGTAYTLGGYLEYAVSPSVSFFLQPSLEYIDSNINIPSSFSTDFSHSAFVNLAIGFRFNVRRPIVLQQNSDN